MIPKGNDMPQHMSRIVIGILFSTLATASFAGNETTSTVYGTQKDAIQMEHDVFNATGPNGFGQHMADNAKAGGTDKFRNLGDFLRFYTGHPTTGQPTN